MLDMIIGNFRKKLIVCYKFKKILKSNSIKV